MKGILRLISAITVAVVMGSAVGLGADAIPRPKLPTSSVVGDYGREEALVIEGNQSFTKDLILYGMAFHLDYQLAAHPAAPLVDYLASLERKITLGYQRAGFPSATVKADADTSAHRVVIRVTEGPRYRCGEILLSGVKTMTNEVVRQKVADGIGGLETSAGSQSNLNAIVWSRDHPAPFDEPSRQDLTQLVEQALASLNYYQPKVGVRIVPDPARKLADLQIEIADEGIKGMIAEIEVSGLHTNTRPQLLDYLKLKPGMEVDARLVATASNRLWRCARFFRHDVSLTPLPAVGQFKLVLDLDEVREAPPLNRELSPNEQTLLKFRDWLAGWEKRPEDLVLSIGLTNSSLRGSAELVLSPSGFAMAAHDSPSNGPVKLLYAIVASEKLTGFYSVWRQSKFVVPQAEQGCVIIQARPPSPKSYGHGNINVAIGMGVRQSQPFRLEMELAPAVFLSMASWMASSLTNGVLTLSDMADGDSQEIRMDAATGRLLQCASSSGGSNAFCFQFRSEEGALARVFKEIAAATADHPNRYVTNRGFGSWVSFFAADVLEPPLLERVLDWFEDEAAPNDPRADPASASLRIHTTLALVREIFGSRSLDALFDPLNRFFAPQPEEDDEEDFIVPADELGSDPRANPLAMICAWVLHSSDAWVPRDSWAEVLVREAACTVAGQAKYTQGELDKLLKSEEIGPVGCLATAYLLGRINPRLARTFAERGLVRLNLAEFRRDYRLLLDTNSVVGDLARNGLALLGNVSEARLTPLVASLASDEAAFLSQLTRPLSGAKGQPPSDALWLGLEQHWNKVPRRYLQTALNHFLPQVQFLTNSQALYNRGLMLSSPGGALQDFDEAAQCFRKAADQGHPGAQLRFGMLCQDGQGVREDFGEAMRWYRKAAEQKEPHAACSIARLYHNGKGVTQDLDEAARWYRLEAEGDCEAAQFSLGLISEARLDTDAAVKWYRLAAAAGVVPAQSKVGDLLSDGLFAKADYVEACQWLSLAAVGGDKMSEIRLRRLKPKLTIEQLREAEKRAAAVTEGLARKKKEQNKK
jgi:TPR repeat protein